MKILLHSHYSLWLTISVSVMISGELFYYVSAGCSNCYQNEDISNDSNVFIIYVVEQNTFDRYFLRLYVFTMPKVFLINSNIIIYLKHID